MNSFGRYYNYYLSGLDELVVFVVVCGWWSCWLLLVCGWWLVGFCLVGWFFWWSCGPVVAGWGCCSWFGSFLLAGVLVGWSCGGVVVPVAVVLVVVLCLVVWVCCGLGCLLLLCCFLFGVCCCLLVLGLGSGRFVCCVGGRGVCWGLFSRLVRLDARWPEYRGPLQTCRHFDGCGHL